MDSREPLRVVIAYTAGCEHTPATRELVLELAEELAQPIELAMVRVDTPEDAVRYRLHGSPTVLVNDMDADPGMRGRTDYGFT